MHPHTSSYLSVLTSIHSWETHTHTHTPRHPRLRPHPHPHRLFLTTPPLSLFLSPPRAAACLRELAPERGPVAGVEYEGKRGARGRRQGRAGHDDKSTQFTAATGWGRCGQSESTSMDAQMGSHGWTTGGRACSMAVCDRRLPVVLGTHKGKQVWMYPSSKVGGKERR